MHDADGGLVGDVHDVRAEYMQVGSAMPGHPTLYVPIQSVSRTDPQKVHLHEDSAELARQGFTRKPDLWDRAAPVANQSTATSGQD